MTETTIPIRNVFYMLAYAWECLDSVREIEITASNFLGSHQFFAEMLCNLLEHAHHTGWAMGYQESGDETRCPRGKIEISRSIKSGGMLRRSLFCLSDELSTDILENQIPRACLKYLYQSPKLERSHRNRIHNLLNELRLVNDVELSKRSFRKARPPNGKRIYAMILSLCELIYDNALPDESIGGASRLPRFLRDPRQMASLFEAFVRNFFKWEQSVYPSVGRSNIEWSARAITPGSDKLLPRMQTDVTLENDLRTLILDTKFYPEALSLGYLSTQPKFHSSSLYQLLTYMSNLAPTRNGEVEGVLLYPTVGYELRHDLNILGSRIRVLTLNLARDWTEIHSALNSILVT